MLTISTRSSGINRRAFLTLGGLTLGGLTLASLSGGRARAGQSANPARGTSVVFLFQQGGPSQFETFDPKPDAPDGIRTVTGITRTALPGVHFGDTMSRLARVADRLTVVRSFQTNNAEHNIVPVMSSDTRNATMGALYSRIVGAVRPQTGMPTNAVIFPQAVCTDVVKGSARGNITATGGLGQVYAPFVPGTGGNLQRDMQLNLPSERFEDRKQLLAAFEGLARQVESRSAASQHLDEVQKQAYQVLLSGGVASALDLTREDPRTVARYDTRDLTKPDGWSKAARGKRGYYTGHARALGKQLLMARRLCEAGCGFVTIHAGYEGVWDMHADGENLNMVDGMEAVGRAFDHAVAAFIEDVESRGLSDRILLVCCGEMGRTPRLNKGGGRDHWARLAPLLLYGGGIRPGQVIGRSTRDGGEPATDNLTPKHLLASLLHVLFDVGQLRVLPGMGEVAQLAEHDPIPGLI